MIIMMLLPLRPRLKVKAVTVPVAGKVGPGRVRMIRKDEGEGNLGRLVQVEAPLPRRLIGNGPRLLRVDALCVSITT